LLVLLFELLVFAVVAASYIAGRSYHDPVEGKFTLSACSEHWGPGFIEAFRLAHRVPGLAFTRITR
jgi:hypothetical protein